MDENMPVGIAGLLRNSGYNVRTVPEENLMGKTIIHYATGVTLLA